MIILIEEMDLTVGLFQYISVTRQNLPSATKVDAMLDNTQRWGNLASLLYLMPIGSWRSIFE